MGSSSQSQWTQTAVLELLKLLSLEMQTRSETLALKLVTMSSMTTGQCTMTRLSMSSQMSRTLWWSSHLKKQVSMLVDMTYLQILVFDDLRKEWLWNSEKLRLWSMQESGRWILQQKHTVQPDGTSMFQKIWRSPTSQRTVECTSTSLWSQWSMVCLQSSTWSQLEMERS